MQWSVAVSYLEVYGESLRDLLVDDSGGGGCTLAALAVQEGGPSGKGVHVAGLREVPVACSERRSRPCLRSWRPPHYAARVKLI